MRDPIHLIQGMNWSPKLFLILLKTMDLMELIAAVGTMWGISF